MRAFRASELIDRPPEEVFAYVTNFDNAGAWVPGVDKVEQVTDGPVAEGTRYMEVRPVRGVHRRLEMEVFRHDPPRAFSAGFTKGGFRVTFEYGFEAEGRATRVELKSYVRGFGLNRLKEPLSAWAIRYQDRRQLRSLKAAIEGNR